MPSMFTLFAYSPPLPPGSRNETLHQICCSDCTVVASNVLKSLRSLGRHPSRRLGNQAPWWRFDIVNIVLIAVSLGWRSQTSSVLEVQTSFVPDGLFSVLGFAEVEE